ncbi:MAG: hypothetical protein WD030_03930, partial [Pirellulales bacterium]
MSNASPIHRPVQPGAAPAGVPLRAKPLPASDATALSGANGRGVPAGGAGSADTPQPASDAASTAVVYANGTAQAGRKQPVMAKPLPAEEVASADAFDDEYDDYEDAPLWQDWIRQSPSWLTSMVLHMVLLLSLALIPVDEQRKPDAKELVVDKAELEQPLEEFTEEEIEQSIDSKVEVETPLTEITALSVSPEDLKIESEEIIVPAEADQSELATSVEVKMSDLLTVNNASNDLLSTVGGMSESGLGGRTAASRAAMVRKAGGNADSERAVEAALTWLASKQLQDGSWSYQQIGASSNPGQYTTRMGATGLVLLPFLGAGYTHESGMYEENIRAALAYMVGNMVVSGGRGRLYESGAEPQPHMYSHGISAIALCEAYGMSGDKKLRLPAQFSLNYIAWAQNPDTGGWLYTPRSAGGDTSVVGWQIMALKSGHMAHLQVPPTVVAKSSAWLDFVQFNSGAAYGYRKKNDRPAHGAMTAVGLLMRMYLGWDRSNPAMQMGVAELSKAGPSNSDMYYNYYATQV